LEGGYISIDENEHTLEGASWDGDGDEEMDARMNACKNECMQQLITLIIKYKYIIFGSIQNDP